MARNKKSAAITLAPPPPPTTEPRVSDLVSRNERIKKVFIISDEAIRRCQDAGLRLVMPSPGNPEIAYSFKLLASGSLKITMAQPSGTRSVLVPAAAFMAEVW